MCVNGPLSANTRINCIRLAGAACTNILHFPHLSFVENSVELRSGARMWVYKRNQSDMEMRAARIAVKPVENMCGAKSIVRD